MMGFLGFLVGMMLALTPRHFPCRSRRALRSQKSGAGLAAYGHSGEIDRLTAYFHSRLRGETVRMPCHGRWKPCVRADRPGEGTGQYGRVIMRYYAEGYAVRIFPVCCLSAWVL